MKIIIEKIEDEDTFKRITTTHTFKVNGKEVRVYEHSDYDSNGGTEEYDTDVDEEDREALTEEEDEVFSDEMYDALKLKVGKKLSVEGWENENENK